MFMTSEFTRRAVAAVLTVVFSATVIIGAVGPAQADQRPVAARIA